MFGAVGESMARFPVWMRASVWIVILPLVMAGFGLWSWHANRDEAFLPTAGQQEQIARLEQVLTRIRGDRYATLTIDGRRYGNPLATQMVERRIAELQSGGVSAEGRGLASWVHLIGLGVAGLGLATAFAGLSGMLLVRRAAQVALHSRERLLSAFSAWRAWLPRYLGLILLMQVIGFLALCAIACLLAYTNTILAPAGRNAFKLYLATILIPGALAIGTAIVLFRLWKTIEAQDEPMDVLGRDVSPEEAPGLWRLAQLLAERVGSAVPDNIVVAVVDSYYVTAHDVRLQPQGKLLKGRTLHLSLPHMTLLSPKENIAVMAHEFGHFAGQDTDYSLRFTPIYSGMHAILAKVDQASDNDWGAPAVSFTAYLLISFDKAVQHWSRQREFAADKVAAGVAGERAVATSLIRITALDKAIGGYLDELVRQTDEAGQDLIGRLAHAVRGLQFEAPVLAGGSATAHPHDTHPPTIERLRALGEEPNDALINSALAEPVDQERQTWLRGLFADADTLQATLLGEFKAAAREYREERRQYLSTLAAEGAQLRELYTRRFAPVLIGLLGLVFLAVATGMGWGSLKAGFGKDSLHYVALAIGVTGILFFGFGIWAGIAARRPILTLTGEGIRVPGIAGEIPWQALQAMDLTAGNGVVVLKFTLAPRLPPLARGGAGRLGVSYQPKRGMLVLNAIGGIRGLKAEALYDLLHTYRAAALARAELSVL